MCNPSPPWHRHYKASSNLQFLFPIRLHTRKFFEQLCIAGHGSRLRDRAETAPQPSHPQEYLSPTLISSQRFNVSLFYALFYSPLSSTLFSSSLYSPLSSTLFVTRKFSFIWWIPGAPAPRMAVSFWSDTPFCVYLAVWLSTLVIDRVMVVE